MDYIFRKVRRECAEKENAMFDWNGKGLSIGELHVASPIVQGGMGVGVSGHRLASAVANAARFVASVLSFCVFESSVLHFSV